MSLSTRDLARELSTDSSTVRRFLRTNLPAARPDKGGRWTIEQEQLRDLKAQFLKMHNHPDRDTMKMIEQLRRDLNALEAKLTK